ncbi:endo-1,4-beta-xylanase [Bythopirellula polymerisocia]|uniref:endo-1,4-beta-xylanase n=1 Tax=Bythopirellula polymerisocia TaxID=2528003 RepID=UPI0018D4809E|nr:endo-1,4-beta-xylanase [Bythopirellula polymerisocia]
MSDFNGTGFDYTFGGFNQTVGANSVRLRDLVDDSGGAGTGQLLNLSSYSDSRFVVDMLANPGNGVDKFDLELIDSSGRTGKWTLGVSNLDVGVPGTLVSATTLANPTHGVGDFANLDLSNITTWQVLGTFSSPSPFDLNFDRVAISDAVSAPPAYPGAEQDAPWRAQAAARIEANRKANLQVNVTDALGNAISGANVSVQMTEHEFGFGSAVVASRLRDNNPVHATYKQKVAELFNLATIENNLKWPPWEGEWGGSFTKSGAQNAVSWLNGQGIDVRGHTLVWPGYSNLPTSVKNLLNNTPLNAAQQQQMRTLIFDHIADIAGNFAGQLAAWDVINETRTNHDVMDNLAEGDLAMVDWFNAALAADPAAKRYINNFGILSSAGGTNTFNQQEYFDTVQFLLNNSAPVDGIGFQAHFSEGDLTGPEDLWTIFDRFDQLGLDMQITEFDFGTTNEQLQADFTRDFLTAVFAHEGIDDFLMWGFWEDAHWRPEAAMFNSDWSIKPNGQAYLDLVYSDWWTDEELTSALAGTVDLRGFKGEYEITVTQNGVEQVVIATLTDGGLILDVSLPMLSADFNGDGDVDDKDLTIWSTGYGTTSGAVQSSGDANGDGIVDGNDYLLWQRQFGSSPNLPLAVVPEPTSWSLFLLFVLVQNCFYRRRKHLEFI